MEQALQVNINDFDYKLPDERIAKYPLEERDASKLLVMHDSKISHTIFRNISELLPSDSLLVFNDTKVIKARLHFQKETGSRIEIFCLEPIYPVDYSLALGAKTKCSWKFFVGNNKKWKTDDLTKQLQIGNNNISLSASKVNNLGNAFEILFQWDNPDVIFSEILEVLGNIPIPPYLNRESESIDDKRYQTIYSKYKGSVAAPTAGLHFTDEVLESIKQKNICTESVTLHVGAGTFQPVKAEVISDHKMHTEHFVITKQNVKAFITYFGNITLVGTTSVRTLESFIQIAIQIFNNPTKSDNEFFISQWEAYDEKNFKFADKTKELMQNALDWMTQNDFDNLNCATQIMIFPGYRFRLTDRLITNFHQPKSTLLLLLAAYIGDDWKKVYNYALDNDFRFLSYGDSCLFF